MKWSVRRRLFAAPLSLVALAVMVMGPASSPSAEALGPNAIRPGFNAFVLPVSGDDASTGPVNIGFNIDFFGRNYTQLYVNNNGNVTFNGPLSIHTPFNLYTTGVPIIAPFFADVRNTLGSPTKYGTGTVDGRLAFGVTWPGVVCYNYLLNLTDQNYFQVLLISRSDTGAGDFDIEFNYNQIKWEAGTSSGGRTSDCLGGPHAARAGYSNGTSANSFEIPGSGVAGSFLDGNATYGLISHSMNSDQLGRYVFRVRNVHPDLSPPVIVGTTTPAPNPAGWNNSDINVSWGVTDAESGITTSTGCDNTAINAETTLEGNTLTCSATNGAGLSASQSVTVKIDKTNPTVLFGAPAPVANEAGWNNSDVSIPFTAGDNLSGVAATSATSPLTFSTEGSSVSGTVTLADVAGNNASYTSTTVKIDKAPPTINGIATTSPNADGWYNAPVTVHLTCLDTLSGIPAGACPPDQVLSAEGNSVSSVAKTVADVAGNVTASSNVVTVKIDRTSPRTSIQLTAAAGWTNVTVEITLTATDNLSGVKGTYYSLDGSAKQAGTTLTISAEGQHNVQYWSEDVAGNVETHKTQQVNIDKTPPTVTAGASPPANANGWNSSNVTVTASGTDGLSGIDICTSVTLSGEAAGQSAVVSCTDRAGNEASAAVTGVNIDKTSPTATANANPGPNGNGWNNTNVTVSFSGSDSLSGIASCSTPVTLSAEGAGQSASGTCRDKAGNSSASATASGISIDKTAPSLAPSVNPNPVLLNGSATASANATDGLSGVASSSCGALNTSSAGSKQVTCSATDKAGNSATASASYSVIYGFNGFLQPILAPVQAFKTGSTIPVKFQLRDANGAIVSNALARLTANGNTVSTQGGANTGNQFRYDTTGQLYIYNLTTRDMTTGSLTLAVSLDDGTTRTVIVTLR